jgi:hypothetical protein
MKGYCSKGQSPQWAVVPVEEEEGLTAPYNIFPHYLIKGTIFGKKKLLNIKCDLIFSAIFVRNVFHSKKK